MHISAGWLLFAHGYPRGRRANPGVFSIPESAGAGMGAQNRVESLDYEPSAPQGSLIFTVCGSWRLLFAQNPVCRHPRLLKTPKKCTLHPTLGTRSKKANSLGLPSYRRRPQGLPPKSFRRTEGPRRAKRTAVLTCPRTIWEVSPGGSDGGGSSRGYSSPKLMPSALASRTRSLWGSTNLSLPATSSSGMWHILPSRRAIM